MAKPKSKEELIEEAKDSVQIQALKLLYEIKGKDIAPMLWEMLQKMPYSKTRDNVQIQALKLLYKIKGKDIAPMLWEMLQKMPYSKAWEYAAEIFSEIAPREINGKEIAPTLWKMLEEMPYGKKWGVLARIYRKIAPPPEEVKIVDYGPGPWTPEQIKEYERQLVEANRKRYALELLGHLKWLEQNYKNEHIIESVFRDLTDARDLRAIPLLIKVLKYNPNWRNRVYAARTIGLIETYNNDSSAIPDLIKALNDSNVPVRIAVSEVLIKLGKADITVPVLFSIFKETSDDRALNLLKEIGNKKVIEGLKECLNSPDKAIREKAEKALREIEEKRQKNKENRTPKVEELK
ncbi:hypothetical protein DRN58_09920 [Thermococci archaeon]|nr:MAG: hypothetical protein DRN58_09920 [Thermococci archaeon]